MRRIDYLFVTPALLILIVLIVIPFLTVFEQSFTDADTFTFERGDWVGAANYSRLIKDQRFWNSIQVTLLLSISTVVLQMLLGFALALLLWKPGHLVGLARGLVLVPMVLPPVVVGILWRMFFQPTLPGVNYLLQLVGIAGPDWFGNTWSALAAIILATTWQWTPFVFLLLLAGLQALPISPYESATIDGAGPLQKFGYITLPLLRRILVFVAIYRLVESFRIFPIVYVMTSGGPGSTTEPVNFYIWIQAFNAYKMGYAGALVMATLILLGLVAGIMIIYGKRSEVIA